MKFKKIIALLLLASSITTANFGNAFAVKDAVNSNDSSIDSSSPEDTHNIEGDSLAKTSDEGLDAGSVREEQTHRVPGYTVLYALPLKDTARECYNSVCERGPGYRDLANLILQKIECSEILSVPYARDINMLCTDLRISNYKFVKSLLFIGDPYLTSASYINIPFRYVGEYDEDRLKDFSATFSVASSQHAPGFALLQSTTPDVLHKIQQYIDKEDVIAVYVGGGDVAGLNDHNGWFSDDLVHKLLFHANHHPYLNAACRAEQLDYIERQDRLDEFEKQLRATFHTWTIVLPTGRICVHDPARMILITDSTSDTPPAPPKP